MANEAKWKTCNQCKKKIIPHDVSEEQHDKLANSGKFCHAACFDSGHNFLEEILGPIF